MCIVGMRYTYELELSSNPNLEFIEAKKVTTGGNVPSYRCYWVISMRFFTARGTWQSLFEVVDPCSGGWRSGTDVTQRLVWRERGKKAGEGRGGGGRERERGRAGGRKRERYEGREGRRKKWRRKEKERRVTCTCRREEAGIGGITRKNEEEHRQRR